MVHFKTERSIAVMSAHAQLMIKDTVVINTHFRGKTGISFEFK
jgi:hypothetical protein